MGRQASNYKKKLRRNLTLLPIDAFLSSLVIIYPILILLFESIAGSFVLAMSVFSVTSITVVCAEIPTGMLSDRWGRKPVLILSNLSGFLGFGCYALATFASFGIPWLFVGAVMTGFCQALYSGNNQAMLYETLRGFRRTKEFAKVNGRMRAMEQVGLCLSGVFAGALLWLGYSFQLLALLTLVPIALSVVVALFMVEPKTHAVEKTKNLPQLLKAAQRVIKHPRLRWFALAASINNGLGYAGHNFFPSFISSVWPLWATPFYKTAQHAIGTIGFWFSGAIVKKFGALKTLWFGNIISSTLSATAYLLHTAFSPFILLASQINYATSQTADSVVQQDYFTDKQRSTMGSLISFLTEMITAVAAIGLGFVADMAGPAVALLTMLLLRILPINAIYSYLYRHRGKRHA